MSEEEYAWVLGAFIAWRNHKEDFEEDPNQNPFKMKAVTGIAGSLHHHQTQSANDLAAGLLLFLIILILFGAKYRAISARNGFVFCKIITADFFLAYWLCAASIKGPRDFSPPVETVPNQSPPHRGQTWRDVRPLSAWPASGFDGYAAMT